MPYRFLFLSFRGIAFACFTSMMVVFTSIPLFPRVPDSTHTYECKGFYLTREIVFTWRISVAGFFVFGLTSEVCRKRQLHLKKSEYFV